MATTSKPAFQWIPPSPKQEQILYWWTPASPDKDLPYVELEGSVRSIKTSTGSYSFVQWASYSFDQEDFALIGKTIGTCLRNVVRPLRKMLSVEPSFDVKEKRSNAEGYHLEITNKENDHTNLFWIYGGKDESSQDLIQGKTLAGGFLDEVLLMPLSFINQFLSRLSVEGAKAWFTFNPAAPSHEIYKTILDPYVEQHKALYIHLTMDDNPSLSQDTKDRISSQWPVGSVWHRRNVMGERVTAEGAVFPFFTDDPKDGFVTNTLPDDLTTWIAAFDYGQVHPTVFLLAAYSISQERWVVVKEFFTKEKVNSTYSEEFQREILDFNDGVELTEVVGDPGGGGVSLLRQLEADYPFLSVAAATKKDVSKELQDLATAMFTHRLAIYKPGCSEGIKQLMSYVWDDKAKKGGKEEPVKINDDFCDALRYLHNATVKYS